MSSYVGIFFSLLFFIRSFYQITSYSVTASEYANWSGDGENESSSAKTKKKKIVPKLDTESDGSDCSSDIGKTLKQAGRKKARTKKGKKLDALFRIQWWRVVLGDFLLGCL